MAPGGKRRIIAGMSGAQAAAGDLLRARDNQATETEEVDAALIEAASGVFASFETFYKARRTYQEGHPALERFFTALDEKLRTALAKYDELAVTVTPKGLELTGQPVFTADRPDLNTWFPLYRDGIRELTLSHGIDRDQISRFCGALTTLAAIRPGEQDDDGEDDAVTMLWDLELEHIGYVAIDTFEDGSAADEESRKRVEKIREMVTVSMMKELVVRPGSESVTGRDAEVARRLKSVALNKADLSFLERENLAALDELPARLREAQGQLYSLEPTQREALASGLAKDPELVEKLLEAVIQALVADSNHHHAKVLTAHIERTFTRLVLEGKLERATQLRRRVIAASRTSSEPALYERLDHAMSADAAVTAIAKALAQREETELRDVIALLEVMPPRAAHVLLPALASVEQRKRRRWVCDVVAPWGQPAVDAAVATLADSAEELALDLLYLLRRSASEAAIVALERASHHAAPAIRASALRLYAEAAPLATIAPRVRVALRDADALVRATALELVSTHRPDGGLRWIKEAIDTDGFAALELGEKKRLLVTYGLVGGDAVAPELVARLEQRNLLQRASIDEDRAAAASALGQIRYEGARPALEKLAGAKLIRAMVKTACREALDDLDRPAAPAAPPIAEVPEEPPPTALPPEPAVMFRAASPPATAPTLRPPSAAAAPTQRLPDAGSPTVRPPANAATARPAVGAPEPTVRLPAAETPRHASAAAASPTARPISTPKASPTAVTAPQPVVRRDSRSAGGFRPMDDGVAVPKPRAATPPPSTAPTTRTPPARTPAAAGDERGVPRSPTPPANPDDPKKRNG